MQKNRREQDKDILPVSFKVFSRLCDEESVSESEKCPSPDHVLPVEGMLRTSGTLVRQRSILDKFNFHRSASYVLVPYSTDHQDLEGEFIIRVFCKALTTY